MGAKVDILPNELSHSVEDPRQSEALNLTIRLRSDLGRKCYVDPHGAFPQATYYLNSSLKRPNYYLKKEQTFDKKVLIHPHNASNIQVSQLDDDDPNKHSNKKRKKRAKKKKKDNDNSKMEERESDEE